MHAITWMRGGTSSLAAGWMWQPEAIWLTEASAGVFWNVAGVAWDVFDNQNNFRLNASRQSTSKGGTALDSYSDVQLAYFHYF
jgi:hypothetical protein